MSYDYHSHNARDVGAAEERHQHDRYEVYGVAEEYHQHHETERELAGLREEVSALYSQTYDLESTLAEVGNALEKASGVITAYGDTLDQLRNRVHALEQDARHD